MTWGLSELFLVGRAISHSCLGTEGSWVGPGPFSCLLVYIHEWPVSLLWLLLEISSSGSSVANFQCMENEPGTCITCSHNVPVTLPHHPSLCPGAVSPALAQPSVWQEDVALEVIVDTCLNLTFSLSGSVLSHWDSAFAHLENQAHRV